MQYNINLFVYTVCLTSLSICCYYLKYQTIFYIWIYMQVGKQTFETSGQSLLFYQKLLLAGLSGAAGGIFGTPGDVINVRMQNDIKLPPKLRRK